MEKRILLPTDFSENSLNAIEYSLRLFENKKCTFYFLNAYQVDEYAHMITVPEPGGKRFEKAKKVSEKGLDSLKDNLELHRDNPKHTYETISIYNPLSYAIKDLVGQKEIDIVIMGTQGTTAAGALLFGTNTVNVMENVPECPILVIPHGYKFSRPKEIVFPTDYNVVFKRKELDPMFEIAKMHKATIIVLHIEQERELDEAQEKNKVLLESMMQSLKYSFHTLTDIKVHKGIGAFIESRKSDMIVFMNKKSYFFGNKLSKPLAKEIETHSIIPVMEISIS